jgi:hypothetical protein
MSKLHSYCVFAILLLLSACDSWPPNESKAKEHFAEKRDSFDRLAEKMRATDYWRVTIRHGTSVEVTPNAYGDYEEKFEIDDDPEWHDLLADVGMFMVVRKSEDSVSALSGNSGGWKENQIGESGFTNNPKMLDDFKLCRPEFKQVACGYCAVILEDDWYLHYIWSPEYFSKDEREKRLNGEIPEDEYSESLRTAMRQCQIDGASAMGYDGQEVIDRWGS